MKLRPIGGFNSPDFHNAVLQNWATKNGIRLVQEGWAGIAFFVTIRPSLGFCIESRGPGIPDWMSQRMHFPFDAACRKSRRAAFARARLVYDGEYILGGYPGKVPLWQRLKRFPIPSFGELLLEGCDPFTERVWRDYQRKRQLAHRA